MKSILTIALFGMISISYAQKSEIYSTTDGAIKGYDPVAYFIDKQPVKGDKSISLDWSNATWYFSSVENRDLFKANPEKYAPQYGGYCAYGVSKGALYKIEPEAWSIVDSKLYLNYDQSVQQKWKKDVPGYIEKANKNWPKVKPGN